jgi:hypothetical protein
MEKCILNQVISSPQYNKPRTFFYGHPCHEFFQILLYRSSEASSPEPLG